MVEIGACSKRLTEGLNLSGLEAKALIGGKKFRRKKKC